MDNIDYALLLNGPWGCGKTYYIENQLKKIIEKGNYKFIYISLNGAIDFSNIRRKVTYQLITHKDKDKKNYDIDFLEDIFDISTQLPKVGSFISFAKKGKDIWDINKLKEINFSKIFFVFDDLERISKKANISDFMGLIYENYTKKGGKTLFVSDELNIDDNNYKKIKEKIIRRTISYEPNLQELIKSLIENKNIESDKTKMFEDKISLFINYLELLEIRNLRTISFIIDNYSQVINKQEIEFIEKYSNFIFINIMILTKEFKEGKISSQNINDKKNLDKLKNNYLMFGMDNKKEDNKDKPYEVIFYEKYNKKYSLNYIFVNEIFNFILTGLINHVELKKEIIQLFETTKSEEDIALDKLSNIRKKEEEDLKNSCEEVFNFMKKGYYSLLKLREIYTLLMFIQEKEYISDWKCDIEEIINKAFDQSSKISKNIPSNKDLDYLPFFNNNYLENKFYKELSKKIKDKSMNKDFHDNKDKINNIFNLAKQNSKKTEEALRKYQHSMLFKDIAETKLISRFFELNNCGLYFFESFLYYDILHISNAGEYGYHQKNSIEKISKFLNENIQKENIQGMRKKRFLEFIASLNDASKHLENTKKKLTIPN